MKCRTCDAEVPPQFVKAIEKNICPACEGPILLDSDKELIDELSKALEEMPNDPQGVAGWLLSNYEVRKIGEAKPVDKFYRGVPEKIEHSEETDKDEKQRRYEGFLERTNMMGQIKQSHAQARQVQTKKSNKLAAFADHINAIDSQYGSGSSRPEIDGNAEDLAAYQEFQREYEAVQNGDIYDGGGAIVPQGQPDPSVHELETTNDGRSYLHEQRLKRAKSQQALMSGGSGGFRRSSG